jgi:hypothetical protein
VSTATEGTRAKHERGRALTLLVASLSAAGAAIVVHDLWKPGTILSAALSPILVTTFDELLHRPIDRLEALIHRRLWRGRPVLVPLRDTPDRWRRALVTGVVAFLIGGVGLTIVELLLSHSLASGGEETTLLGGSVRHRPASSPPAPPAPAPTTPATTTVPAKVTTTAKPRASTRQRSSTHTHTTTVILALPPLPPRSTRTTSTTPTTTTLTLTTQTTTAPNGSTTVSTVTTPPPG